MDMLGVLIGRFQPFHNGHLAHVRRALDYVDDTTEIWQRRTGRVLLLMTSPERIDDRHPFEYAEMRKAIIESLTDQEIHRVIISSIADIPSDKEWQYDVIRTAEMYAKGAKVVLFGDDSEPSSHYLKHFPEWNHSFEEATGVHAEDVRRVFFKSFVVNAGWDNYRTKQPFHEPDWHRLESMVPHGTFDMLQEFHREAYEEWCEKAGV